jgi:hypothetical protein
MCEWNKKRVNKCESKVTLKVTFYGSVTVGSVRLAASSEGGSRHFSNWTSAIDVNCFKMSFNLVKENVNNIPQWLACHLL